MAPENRHSFHFDAANADRNPEVRLPGGHFGRPWMHSQERDIARSNRFLHALCALLGVVVDSKA